MAALLHLTGGNKMKFCMKTLEEMSAHLRGELLEAMAAHLREELSDNFPHGGQYDEYSDSFRRGVERGLRHALEEIEWFIEDQGPHGYDQSTDSVDE